MVEATVAPSAGSGAELQEKPATEVANVTEPARRMAVSFGESVAVTATDDDEVLPAFLREAEGLLQRAA